MTAKSWEVLKLFISIPISSELVIVACQPAMVWWGAVCIKNQLRVETGLVRGGHHSVQCSLLCSHHVLILSCQAAGRSPVSSVSIQLIIVCVALRPSSDPWVTRPPTTWARWPAHDWRWWSVERSEQSTHCVLSALWCALQILLLASIIYLNYFTLCIFLFRIRYW